MENPDLKQAMRRLQRSISGRHLSTGQAAAGAQLSLALVEQRAPDDILLFGPAGEQPRAFLRDRRVKLPNGRRATYRGEALRQDDWAVWSQLLDMLRRQAGERLEFAPRSLLKTMGWGNSVPDRCRLRDCLERMQATTLKNTRAQPAVVLSMIERCEWLPSPGGRGGRWRVWIASEAQALFADLN